MSNAVIVCFPLKEGQWHIQEYRRGILGQRSSHVRSLYGPQFLSDFGYLVDRARTHQFPFLGALVMLAGCMVILHMSHSLEMFVIGRLLQGCPGALVVVVAFALLNDFVPQERLGQTLGYLGSAIASRSLFGPVLGGVVYHGGGYDAVFYVVYSIIAIDMGMRIAMVEKKAAEKWDHRPSSEGSNRHITRTESSTTCEAEAPPEGKALTCSRSSDSGGC